MRINAREMDEKMSLETLEELAQEDSALRFKLDEVREQRLQLMTHEKKLRAGLMIDEVEYSRRHFRPPLTLLALCALALPASIVAPRLGYDGPEPLAFGCTVAVVALIWFAFEKGRLYQRRGL
jgi:hypothetical protein